MQLQQDEIIDKDEVLKMARQAGIVFDNQAMPYYERFAKLVADVATAKEREACAKVCDDIDVEYEGEDVLATWCSRAIRARGEAT